MQNNETLYVCGTMAFERRLLAFVRSGDVTGLKGFLETNAFGTPERLADKGLRYLKILFISMVTLVSRAAIDGGLLEEESIYLCEEYIAQCEELFSPETVLRLLNQMVLDYTGRVFSVGIPAHLSPLIASVVVYIKENFALPLTGRGLAEIFHISRNTLNRRFARELGITLGEYISMERISRAENLLLHTDNPLAEIAAYLGYASQSHFQTRFKAVKKQTSLDFRLHGRA